MRRRHTRRRLDLRVLILGGYGFIGREIAGRLIAAGHDIVILGRNAAIARRLFPNVGWIKADLTEAQPVDVWQGRLEGIDAVVNASGVLQPGARDKLEAVHHHAISTLVRACEACGVKTFVQISSVGATPDATTEFMRSKARGDARVSSSSLSWFIVRPGLVIGPNAYGGTALIRMLAGVPFVLPIAFGKAPIQTVSVHDLTAVVLGALEGRIHEKQAFDLAEQTPHSLREVISEFRLWLGFGEARIELSIPHILLRGIAKCADALGYLGWRPPLRTTTVRILSEGVLSEHSQYMHIGSQPLSDLRQTLADLPSTLQERWFARLYLAMPAILAVLALFWILTGVTALLNLDESVRMTGLSDSIGRFAVMSGAIVDMTLGAAILYRPWSKFACLGMAAVTLLYIAAGSLLRPDLWADPLGSLLKAIPVLILALIAALLVEDR